MTAKDIARLAARTSCGPWCGLGTAQVTLVRQVLGMCLRVQVTLGRHPGAGAG
ncbi:hypothetical protein ACH4ZX_18460 [Streptomyces sp. NPDC020490]|uniref:hypothetical protein n=1 Tax=Streptomyces sp. NPDC020490 TaxID=3365078 RepID=UPI0037AB04C9